jgi:hypothetical protein
MNKTGHPPKSPISENEIDNPVRRHLMDREKFGEERYLCMFLGFGSFMMTSLLQSDGRLCCRMNGDEREVLGHPARIDVAS